MDVLAGVLAVFALGACYDPSLRDCTVSCERATDCAADQVCGTDRLCASAAVAGHCAAELVPDARMAPHPDAPMTPHPDAAPPPPPDASLTGVVHVDIASRGRVTLMPSNQICESPNDQGISCDLVIAPGAVTLHQMTTHGGDKFDSWSGACTGGGGDCHTVVVLGATTTVGATFEEGK